MAILLKIPLKTIEVEDLGGGLNEGASPNKVPIRECILGENFRVSSDGKSKTKRSGLIKFDSIYDFVSKKVFGAYGVEETDEVKMLTFLEDEIKQKSGNSWSSIFSPTKKIDRPISSIQDKGLVLVAGYEKLITIQGNQAFYSGVEAPASPPTVTTKAAGTDHKATGYPESVENKISGTTIAFVATTKKITDSNNGLAGFLTGYKIEVTGSVANNGIKTIATGGVPGEIVIVETVVDGTAGPSVTIEQLPTVDDIQDHCGELGATVAQTLLSQSFKVVDNYELTKIKLELKKIGSPTGNLWVEIHSSKSGTSLTKNASVNIVGQGTANLDVSTLTSSFVEYELSFSGTPPQIAKDSIYYLVVYRSFAVSGSAYVEVGFDCSSPAYTDGKYWEINGSLSWESYESIDLVFEVHGKKTDTKTLISLGVKETGAGGFYGLRELDDFYLLAQEFKLSENSTLEKIKIPLKRIGGPSGVLWAEVHSSQDGTSATKGASTNIVGQPSDDIASSSIQTYFDWIEFTFSGTKPSLTADTIYYLVLYCDYTIIEDNNIGWTLNQGNWRAGETIAFVTTTHKITDSTNSLAGFLTGHIIEVSGSAHNDGIYNIVTGGVAGEVIVSQALVDEALGPLVTIKEIYLWSINDEMTWAPSLTQYFSFELIGTGDADLKRAEYSFDNLDDIQDLRESVATTLMAQEFQVQEASDVTKVKLYLSKFGTPTGNIWAEIHSAQVGTKTAKNQSDNIVGEASDSVDISTLSAFPTYGWITFTFSGVRPPLTANTIYYLVIYGDFAVSASAHVKVGHDKISPTYSIGQRWDIDDGLAWTKKEDIDLIFEVWLSVSDLVGDFSFVVTYKRGGNYQCESNPSPVSEKVNIIAGKVFELSNIPVSSEPEVTEKGIYRTQAGGEVFYWEATIPNSQTTYDSSSADSALGDEVSYENYPPPVGKTIEVWDGCLWVADVDDNPEAMFKSRQGYTEQFQDMATSFYPLKEKEAGRIKRLIVFNNLLYGLKDNSIWFVSRAGDSYFIDKVLDGTGTRAPDSVMECNVKGTKCLIFLSNHFKIEFFDGQNPIYPELSDFVKKTLASINKNYVHTCTADKNEDEHEYRLAIPTGSSMVPNKVIVFNYMTGNFFVDSYNQNISLIKKIKTTLGVEQMVYGTQGQFYLVDPQATTDDGVPITCKFRTGWTGGDKWLEMRNMFLDFILPTNKNLIFKIYSNFREAPDLDLTLAGSTPSGTLPEIRNIIHKKIISFINGSFFSFEFINAEDVSSFEINKIWLYVKTSPPKRTIQAV